MKCPKCRTANLATKELEDSLTASECEKCNGIWIKASHYWRWLKAHGDILPEKPEEHTATLCSDETKEIKICPDCGHFLTRRKVGHGIDFHIERCATCGGIWLDKNEWEVLKSRNLHDEIHFVFSTTWQEDIIQKEQKQFYSDQTMKILGEKDYKYVDESNNWLAQHPKTGTHYGVLE